MGLTENSQLIIFEIPRSSSTAVNPPPMGVSRPFKDLTQGTDKEPKESPLGKYVRAKSNLQRTLSDAVREAKEDHFVDCPNAPLKLRAAAFIVDMMLLLLVGGFLNKLFISAALLFQGEGSTELIPWFRALWFASEVTIFYFYSLWSVHQFGGTPAKLLLNLRVVDRDTGQNLNWAQVLVREILGKWLGFVSFGFGFAMAYFDKDRQAIHDRISYSSVKIVDGGKS